MNVAEEIVETYVRYVKGWFTNTNIVCQKNKDIDILAIDLANSKKYHIEVSVSVSGNFRKLISRDPDSILDKPKKKRTVTYFLREKFQHPIILQKLSDLHFENPQKIIVTHTIERSPEMQKILGENQIEFWLIEELVNEIVEKIDNKHQTDTVLRFCQFIKESYMNKTRQNS